MRNHTNSDAQPHLSVKDSDLGPGHVDTEGKSLLNLGDQSCFADCGARWFLRYGDNTVMEKGFRSR